MENDTPTPPAPGPAPARRQRSRLGRLGIATIAAVVGVLTVTAAVAMATSGGDAPPTTAAADGAPGTTATPAHDHDGAAKAGRAGRHARHQHPRLTPYDQRYDAATASERTAADDLRAAVAKTVAKYPDPAAAKAAGFLPPRRPDAKIAHYRNPRAIRDGKVLDPDAPEGLVYYTGGPKPVLLGAFFVAPAGAEVPGDTGGIVAWHSHDPACTGFFATDEAPCTGQRRMLHVWTFDQLTLTRPDGRQVTIELTDPFGTPLRASVRKAA
jgi:hypothetical protein